MEITISGKDKNLLRQVEKLAKRLGLNISKKEEVASMEDQKVKSEKFSMVMEEMAASGAFSSIKDPVAWQRENRRPATEESPKGARMGNQKPLPGGEES